MVLDKNAGKQDEGIALEQAPKLTKLAIRQTDAPIELYKVDIVRSEDGGRRIKNYANKTGDYEWWVDPENRNWNAPDGKYLVSQGPNLWLVNVTDREVEWRSIKTLAQRIAAHWNKLTIEDIPAGVSHTKGPTIAPIVAKIEGDLVKESKANYEDIMAKVGTPEERLGGTKKSKSKKSQKR